MYKKERYFLMDLFTKNHWCNEADLEKLVKLQQRKIKELKEDLRRCHADVSDDDYIDEYDDYDSYERRRRRSLRPKRETATTRRVYDEPTGNVVTKKVNFHLKDRDDKWLDVSTYTSSNQDKLKSFVESFLADLKKSGYAKNSYFTVRVAHLAIEANVQMKREHFATLNTQLKKYLAKYYMPGVFRNYRLEARLY